MEENAVRSHSLPDTDFGSTRYGLLRISQVVICFLCLILTQCVGVDCWAQNFSNFNFFSSIASSSMIFAILVMIMFCFRLQDPLEKHINVPLTLCVGETVSSVFLFIASILIIVSFCPRTGLNIIAKIAGLLGILGTFAFGYAAKISYQWFRTGTLEDTS